MDIVQIKYESRRLSFDTAFLLWVFGGFALGFHRIYLGGSIVWLFLYPVLTVITLGMFTLVELDTLRYDVIYHNNRLLMRLEANPEEILRGKGFFSRISQRITRKRR